MVASNSLLFRQVSSSAESFGDHHAVECAYPAFLGSLGY